MKRFLLAFILLLFLAAPVQAAYMYNFEYTLLRYENSDTFTTFRSIEYNGEWSFIVDNLLSPGPPTEILPSGLETASSTYPYALDNILMLWGGTDDASAIAMNFIGDAPDDFSDSVPFAWHFNPPFVSLGTYDSVERINENSNDMLEGTLTITQVPSVPEPSTILLFALGLMGLAGVRRKIKK